MKNKIIRYLIVVLCVIAILFALVKVFKVDKKADTYLVIGDYLSVSGNVKGNKIVSFSSLLGDYFIENNLVSNVNYNYVSSSVTSSFLLEMINKGAFSGKDDGLVSVIEKSKYITISVGMNDILDYIRYDSNKQEVIYDKEFIKRKIEIMKQNYFEIIEEIKSFNSEVSVYLIGYYCPFDNGEEVFGLLNSAIEDVGKVTSSKYVDVSADIKKENLINKYQVYINSEGQKEIFLNIKEAGFVGK